MLTRGKFKACLARFSRKLQHNSNMRAELILPAQCQRNVEGINITKHFFNTFPDILKLVLKLHFFLAVNVLINWREETHAVHTTMIASPCHSVNVVTFGQCVSWFFFHSRLTYGDIYRNSFKLVVNGRNAVTLKIRQCLE